MILGDRASIIVVASKHLDMYEVQSTDKRRKHGRLKKVWKDGAKRSAGGCSQINGCLGGGK
jgi:hypothetical protein